jgi:hypothetical protein
MYPKKEIIISMSIRGVSFTFFKIKKQAINLIKKKLKKKVKYTFDKGLMRFSFSNDNIDLKSLVIPQVLQIILYFSL